MQNSDILIHDTNMIFVILIILMILINKLNKTIVKALRGRYIVNAQEEFTLVSPLVSILFQFGKSARLQMLEQNSHPSVLIFSTPP